MSKKHKLPKNIGLAAPVVVDAVVDHLFQLLLAAQHGSELAEAMEVFSRNIPPQILSELVMDADNQAANAGASGRSSSVNVSRVSSRNANAVAARRGRSRRTSRGTEAEESKTDSVSAENVPAAGMADPAITHFTIRLQNDDVHTLTEVVDIISSAVGISKGLAREMVDEADRVGDIALKSSTDLLKCASIAGSLVRSSLNISVTPEWWYNGMEKISDIIQWLFSLSCASDGLNEIVSEALCKERIPIVKGFESLSGMLCVDGKGSIDDFFKDQHARVNGAAAELFEAVVGAKSVAEWAHELESLQQKMFNFHVKSGDEAPSIVRNANGDLVRCENIFIEDFLKSVALSKAYSRHQSVRDGVDTVVARFFSAAEDTLSLSGLTLLIQNDCILRKSTVKNSHLLLREHMLGSQFRTEMLESYVRSYKAMTTNFLRGLGNASDTVFDFAVQFLTVPHLVKNYTREMTRVHPERPHLLGELLASLELVFRSAINPKDSVLNVDHPALGNQKYKVCLISFLVSMSVVCLFSHLSIFILVVALCGQHGVRAEHWRDSERAGMRFGEPRRVALLSADLTSTYFFIQKLL